MDIKAIEEYVQAAQKAYDIGIMSIWGNQIHVTSELFEKLMNEKGSLNVVEDYDDVFPFRTELMINGFTYYSIHKTEDFKQIFGGNINECITTK
ncbi:hypothetical protein CN931_01290 [Bacillus sp. AFS054943]|uniref:hypothetical protein n=1 Tax=Bacillus sp. AFS054943 TaxID=2033506 RepID=UPI000BFDD466|nr:hypothetical protein [Bacillus sp. AFS054943]PGL87846.1 hypothetical protein CN931_01290 [Bacillus sp. AFS054943]